jgi:hypothetical protein
LKGALVGRDFAPESFGRDAARDGRIVSRAGGSENLHLAVPASPDSSAQTRGCPHGVGVTREEACQQGALGRSLAPGAAGLPETIPITVEAITVTSQGVTYRTERTTLTATRVLAGQQKPAIEPAALDREERKLAAKVLGLLTALDPQKRWRKALPLRVFNLYYQQRLEPAEIARTCKCDRSLVFERLASIRGSLPWSPERLHEVSPHVQAMEDALTDDRAEHIDREHAPFGDEGGDQESN